MDVRAEPMTPGQFASFGTIVSCDGDDRPVVSANLGSADRRDYLVDVANHRPLARLNVATFRCRPAFAARPLELGILEKHPMSTQVFIPMSPGAFLVVVASGDDAPDLSTARAFLVEGHRGIAYAAGVWHHPMIALDRDIDFTCLVWEDGTPLDCVTVSLTEKLTIALT